MDGWLVHAWSIHHHLPLLNMGRQEPNLVSKQDKYGPVLIVVVNFTFPMVPVGAASNAVKTTHRFLLTCENKELV